MQALQAGNRSPPQNQSMPHSQPFIEVGVSSESPFMSFEGQQLLLKAFSNAPGASVCGYDWNLFSSIMAFQRLGLFAAALLFGLATRCHAMYFHVIEGQQRCFIEEVPEGTLVIGTYANPDFKPWGTPEFSATVRSD